MKEISLPPIKPQAARPKRADAVANRQMLLDTARRLIAEHGVEDVTMSQVAREAGVGKGTLYRAFDNKGSLCLALMDDDMRHFQEQTFAALNEQHQAPALEKLGQFLRSMIHFFDRHALLMLEVQAHMRAPASGRPVNQTQLHHWFHQTVQLLVQSAQREGAVSAESDPAYLADLILAPLNPTMFRHQRLVLGLDLDTISDRLIAFVLGGIAK